MLRDRGLARGRRRDVFELTELRFWAPAGVAPGITDGPLPTTASGDEEG